MSARLIKMTSNARASSTFIVACKRYFVASTSLNYASNKSSSGGREGTKTKGSTASPKKEGEQDKKPKVAKKEGDLDKKAPAAKQEEKASGQKPDAKK